MSEMVFLTQDDVAIMLRVSVDTVRRMRQRGDGPPFVRLSKRRILYRRSDVDAWISKQQKTKE